jgi:hypothetical protein
MQTRAPVQTQLDLWAGTAPPLLTESWLPPCRPAQVQMCSHGFLKQLNTPELPGEGSQGSKQLDPALVPTDQLKGPGAT